MQVIATIAAVVLLLIVLCGIGFLWKDYFVGSRFDLANKRKKPLGIRILLTLFLLTILIIGEYTLLFQSFIQE